MGAFTSSLATDAPHTNSHWTAADTSGSDALWASSLANLEAVVNNGSLADYLGTMNVTQTCDISTAYVRKEYTTLTDAEKIAYSNAMKCMFSKDPVRAHPWPPPPLLFLDLYPVGTQRTSKANPSIL